MKRRDFMSWIGLGFLASSLPVALAACGPKASDPAADAPEAGTETAGGTETTGGDEGAIGSLADLDANGVLISKDAAAGPVVIVRDPANTEQVIALDPRCTHQGCDVEWQAGEGVFTCPCHGSKFKPDGSVAEGPAVTALASYDVTVENDQVFVN